MNLTPEKEKVKRVLLTARTKQAAAPRPTSGKSAEADVLIVAVRHISFRDADEILSRWNAAEMGYVFHICSENLQVQDYLQEKYLLEETKE
nr:MAG TPA: hypothetical protein [Caudoviricetes sp.]DAZ73833.1 MAG TPA: hypothetical protein [Caudoviricetes sp.]